jgi:hypothetical protein
MNQSGFKAEINSIKRVSVDTHKTMNFTATQSISNNRLIYIILSQMPYQNEMLIARIQYLRYGLTILINYLHTLINITLN